jgi:hypothetical protein
VFSWLIYEIENDRFFFLLLHNIPFVWVCMHVCAYKKCLPIHSLKKIWIISIS